MTATQHNEAAGRQPGGWERETCVRTSQPHCTTSPAPAQTRVGKESILLPPRKRHKPPATGRWVLYCRRCGGEMPPQVPERAGEPGWGFGFCIRCGEYLVGDWEWQEGEPTPPPEPSPLPSEPAPRPSSPPAPRAAPTPQPRPGGNGHGLEAPAWLEEVPPWPEEAPQPNLPPIGKPVAGRLAEVNAAEIRAEALAGEDPLTYLPFLGQHGYIVRGWAHLVAGYPKAGKTELLTRLVGEWRSERIVYFTEEPRSVWKARLAELDGDWGHVNLVFALGVEPEIILERIARGGETVAVIDTVRNLLWLQDETDNSEVARVLNPFIATCRGGGKTLLLAHHVRKGGGEHGEGITGGHAFLGVVDVAIEVLRVEDPNKRRVRGWGRVIAVPELLYTQQPDKTFRALGSPQAVELEELKRRVQEVLNGDWQTRKEILAALDEPQPGLEQLRLALETLVGEGVAERDPAQPKPGATYRYRLAGVQPNLPPALL